MATVATSEEEQKKKRSRGLRNLLLGVLAGGGAIGSKRLGDWFLPQQSVDAIEKLRDSRDSLRRALTLGGGKIDETMANRIIEGYAMNASRLAASPVAGMQGHDFVKFIRTKLPVPNPWKPTWSDAHYDAFARGPAYGAAQLMDEQASDIANRTTDKGFAAYLKKEWPLAYKNKLREVSKSQNLPSLVNNNMTQRESVAYAGRTINPALQYGLMKAVINDPIMTKDTRFIGDGFSENYLKVKKDLAHGLIGHSFDSYVGIGDKAKAIKGTLGVALPAILGAAGLGLGVVGVRQLLKAREERRKREEAAAAAAAAQLVPA